MSNAEVRAVVHACVPEGVDRFYQEVGRSGRDGRAALSLLVPTYRNLEEGPEPRRQKLITTPKGAARWKQMFLTGTHSKSASGEDVLEMEFDVAPGADPDRIDMRNEQSTTWNLRVVAMMAIAESGVASECSTQGSVGGRPQGRSRCDDRGHSTSGSGLVR